MVPVLEESRSQGEDTAGKFLWDRPAVADFFALKAPDRLPVAILEVEVDACCHAGPAKPQIPGLRVEHNGGWVVVVVVGREARLASGRCR